MRLTRHLTNISEQLFIVKTECGSTNGQATDSFVDYLKRIANDFSHDFEELYWFDGETDDLYNTLSIKLLRLGINLNSDPAYAYNLDSQEIKEIILKSDQLIQIINPNGMHFLDGIVEEIKNGALRECDEKH